jgi:hypothetical protein
MTRPWSDGDRTVEFDDEILPDPASDESRPGGAQDDERLVEDRPPHWDR